MVTNEKVAWSLLEALRDSASIVTTFELEPFEDALIVCTVYEIDESHIIALSERDVKSMDVVELTLYDSAHESGKDIVSRHCLDFYLNEDVAEPHDNWIFCVHHLSENF